MATQEERSNKNNMLVSCNLATRRRATAPKHHHAITSNIHFMKVCAVLSDVLATHSFSGLTKAAVWHCKHYTHHNCLEMTKSVWNVRETQEPKWWPCAQKQYSPSLTHLFWLHNVHNGRRRKILTRCHVSLFVCIFNHLALHDPTNILFLFHNKWTRNAVAVEKTSVDDKTGQLNWG